MRKKAAILLACVSGAVLLAVATALFFSSGADDGPVKESLAKLLIRSPYAEEDMKVLLEISDAGKVHTLHSILAVGDELAKPYPAASPQLRFEFVKTDDDSLVYDFVSYRTGEVTLLFWHDKRMYSVPIGKIRGWCRDAGVSFEKYILLSNSPEAGSRE